MTMTSRERALRAQDLLDRNFGLVADEQAEPDDEPPKPKPEEKEVGCDPSPWAPCPHHARYRVEYRFVPI